MRGLAGNSLDMRPRLGAYPKTRFGVGLRPRRNGRPKVSLEVLG